MTQLSDADLRPLWDLVMDACPVDVREIEDLHPGKRSLAVPFDTLNEVSPDLAEQVLQHPLPTLFIGRQALAMHAHHEDVDVRITDLPDDAAVDVSQLRAEHIGRLISVSGLVSKATTVRPEIVRAAYRCKRCRSKIFEPQDPPNLTEPLECYKEQEGCGRSAGSTKFTLLPELCETIDTQKVELQENPEALVGGSQPGRITAWLRHELAGVLTAGTRATLNGVLRMRMGKDKTVVNELELDVISVQLDECRPGDRRLTEEDVQQVLEMSRDPNVLRDLVRSIAPGIHGNDTVKEALLLQQVGGVTKHLDDGQKFRGDTHILLVGDPGVAKTMVGRQTAELAPRGVYASGKSSTAAGLTAAAVKDDFGEGRWTLEAGALVQADMGLAVIDEMDKMSDQDRSAMHEAMESQRVSVAKAGITASLQCRCSVLGIANPKYGRFDGDQPLAEQIDLPPALLSRFDLIFALIDKPNAERDRSIAEHICRGHQRAGALKHAHDGDDETDGILADTEGLRPVYDRDRVRKYLLYARMQLPILTDEAIEAMVTRYLSIRAMSDVRNGAATVPITPRQMEAYIRLAEASAKLRLSRRVEAQDAQRAVDIVQEYLRSFGTSEGGTPDIDRLFTGRSSKERSKLQTVESIIRDRQDIAVDELLQECKGRGIGEAEVRRVVEKLKSGGQLYEPTVGRIRVL